MENLTININLTDPMIWKTLIGFYVSFSYFLAIKTVKRWVKNLEFTEKPFRKDELVTLTITVIMFGPFYIPIYILLKVSKCVVWLCTGKWV